MAEQHSMAPGVADKVKVMQLFHHADIGVPKCQSRVERIDRVVRPSVFQKFLEGGDSASANGCMVVFYVPRSAQQLARLREHGFTSRDLEAGASDGEGVPVVTHLAAALRRSTRARTQQGERSTSEDPQHVCVLLCHPHDLSVGLHPAPKHQKKFLVQDPRRLLLTHVVCFQHLVERAELVVDRAAGAAGLRFQDQHDGLVRRRRKTTKQLQQYAKVRDPLVQTALKSLQCMPEGMMNTVLLPSESEEAELVISLYLSGGGGSRLQCPPGVDLREALGGVVVQRIGNQPLYRDYSAVVLGGPDGASDGRPGERGTAPVPRYREDLVWHGTRLKRVDGEGTSLAAKLQSIAERGFDPSRCMKGAAAQGGIWVATMPLASFGHGCDGLVAFILCLAKTHFNEWVDATCARVLQRERVLPLYSLVHT